MTGLPALRVPAPAKVNLFLHVTGRRGDLVTPDGRAAQDLAAGLIAGESGLWVGACTARWALDALPLKPLQPALQAALQSPYPPLREAASLALAKRAPRAIA